MASDQELMKSASVLPHHTALCVNDFERAKHFYIDFLGFTLEGEMDQRGEAALGEVVGLPGAVIRWAMLSRNGYRLELFKYYTPQGQTQARRQCDFGYSHMAFEVEDVDAVYEKVKEAGYECLSPPRELRGGATKVFYVLEPEGAATEFVQFLKPNASSLKNQV